jgi:hypothetical protein
VKTSFGASGPSIDSPATLKLVASYPAVSRGQVILSQYQPSYKPGSDIPTNSPDKECEEYINLGIPFFLNCNYQNVDKDPITGEKIPNPFPSTQAELDKYRSKLEPVLAYFQNHPKKDLIKLVGENEPTTKAFHSGPMSDYLKMLQFC